VSMILASDSLPCLVIWILSAISGIGVVYSYFNFSDKEKRLPFATEFADLDMRCTLKKEEVERLQQELSGYEEKKAEREQCIADVEQARKWVDDNRQELQKLEGERSLQEVLRQNLQQLKEDYASANENLNQIKSECALKLSEKMTLEEKANQLDQRCLQLKNEQEELLRSIEGNKIICDDYKNRIDNFRSEEVRYRDSVTRMKDELNALVEQKEKYDQIALDVMRIEKQREGLNNEIDDLNKRRTGLQGEELELQESIYELNNAKKEEESDLKKIQKQLGELKIELDALITKRDKTQEEKDKAQSERNVLQNEYELYHQKIQSHKEKADGKSAFDELLNPYFAIKKDSVNINESDALQRLEKGLSASKLIYSKRMVYSFHTSLKINEISPLVVLSGISGTGKSQLPCRYADAMGIHFLNMAVQPRWDSPQDIFGFYNYLEQRYKATELTRALMQAERYNRENWPIKQDKEYPLLDNQMMLVLFDEMNLARVEYYFSDFLSKLEMRRGLDPREPKDRQKAEVALDIGDMRLYVDRNVLFVGTMNEDESTQSLSDKILDRANMLRFGKPKELVSAQILPDKASGKAALTFDNWNKWIKTPDQIHANEESKLSELIQKLNDAMGEIGRPFGHRTHHAIQSYVANYPTANSFNIAVADQIEQRIIPKLRNISCQESKASSALGQIADLIEQVGDLELLVAFDESRQGDFFEWKGVERPIK
jgi:AAA domain (dynein-related subfamily)